MAMSRLNYVYSCDLDERVEVKVGTLEGKLGRPSCEDLSQNPSLQHCVTILHDDKEKQQRDLFVTLQVHCDGRVVGLPVQTSYKSFSTRWNWNEWVSLPVKYSELSRDAQLALNIWDFHDSTEPHVIGGTSIPLFSKRGVFRKGMYDLKMWPFEKADGSQPSKTPGKIKREEGTNEDESKMRRLAKLSKKHRSGLMEKVDWLDRLTFREIEVVNEAEKRYTDNCFLMVELPRIHHSNHEHVVIYFEKNGGEMAWFQPYPDVVRCPDSEVGLENLVEAKHHVLTRSARTGPTDRELKPNAPTRDILDQIIQSPPSAQLSSERRDIVWKFRFYLSSNKKALGKFLQSVQWDQSHEVRQAIELLKEWAPMDVEDALELLSPQYQHPAVRRYAVSRLRDAPQEDLLLYLLQLVQALKYENYKDILTGTDASFIQQSLLLSTSGVHSSKGVDQESFTVPGFGGSPSTSGGPGEDEDAILFDVRIPGESTNPGSRSPIGLSKDRDRDASLSPQPQPPDSPHPHDSLSSPLTEDEPDLATFLISAACKDATLANYLFWYLKVECESYADGGQQHSNSIRNQPDAAGTKKMYITVMKRLSRALFKGGTEARRRRAHLMGQQAFVDRLLQVMKLVAKESGNRSKKIEFLKTQLSTQEGNVQFSNLQSLPLPLDPHIKVQSIVVEKAHLFNSALMPCKIVFRTIDGRDYSSIFKVGDDLRQDQLIIQMIQLMDKLLREENLDLRLTPYKVLATSLVEGFVQYVDSLPLSNLLKEWNSIHEFLRYYRPSAKDPYGIETKVMENYVRSCAGYSVICYLFGIGDRHQHNLLVCKDGHLFHIDFGYILGRDPKPLPPLIKLTKEMIEGMGGQNSSHWQEFRRLCYTAFIHLRRHSNLFLNLFSLIVDASIPDIALEPDKAVKKLEERFHLDLDDEQAVQLMQHIIDTSITAKMAVVSDFVHELMQRI